MKLIIVAALAFVAAVAAAPVDEPIPIVRSDFVTNENGGYSYNSETGDGIVKSEVGELKEVLDEDNKPHLVLVVRGQYSYTDPEGNKQEIVYSADEQGFKADGPSIPKVPAPVARR